MHTAAVIFFVLLWTLESAPLAGENANGVNSANDRTSRRLATRTSSVALPSPTPLSAQQPQQPQQQTDGEEAAERQDDLEATHEDSKQLADQILRQVQEIQRLLTEKQSKQLRKDGK